MRLDTRGRFWLSKKEKKRKARILIPDLLLLKLIFLFFLLDSSSAVPWICLDAVQIGRYLFTLPKVQQPEAKKEKDRLYRYIKFWFRLENTEFFFFFTYTFLSQYGYVCMYECIDDLIPVFLDGWEEYLSVRFHVKYICIAVRRTTNIYTPSFLYGVMETVFFFFFDI